MPDDPAHFHFLDLIVIAIGAMALAGFGGLVGYWLGSRQRPDGKE